MSQYEHEDSSEMEDDEEDQDFVDNDSSSNRRKTGYHSSSNPTVSSVSDINVPCSLVQRVEKLLNSDLNNNLSEEQKRCVCSQKKLILVSADPGTGKTTVLVSRTLKVMLDWLKSPRNPDGCLCPKNDIPIVLLTFTNGATEEMRSRLFRRINECFDVEMSVSDALTRNSVCVSTYHSFFFQILKTIMRDVEKKSISSLSESEELKLLKKFLELHPQYSFSLPYASKHLGKWKFAEINGSSVGEKEKKFTSKFRMYVESEVSGKLSYDDIMIETYKRKDLIGKYIRGYHFLLDEGQDMNFTTFEVFKLHFQILGSLFVVGDPWQQIYSSTGFSADFMNLSPLEDPGTERVSLTKNFRSCPLLQRLFSMYKGNIPPENLKDLSLKDVFEFISTPDEGTEFQCISLLISFILKTDKEATVCCISRTGGELNKFADYLDSNGFKGKYTFSERDELDAEELSSAKKKKKKRDEGEQKSTKSDTSKYKPEVSKKKKKKRKNEKKTKNPFLDFGVKGTEQSSKNWKKEMVFLMNAHKSKGKEFSYVFILNCVDGIFPKKYLEEIIDIDEEKRVLYVALTRAIKKVLIFSPIFLSGFYLNGDKRTTSQFIKSTIPLDIALERDGMDITDCSSQVVPYVAKKKRSLGLKSIKNFGIFQMKQSTPLQSNIGLISE